MKRLKAFLITAVVTAISIIPVLADITGITSTTTTTSVTTTDLTEMEYLIGDIDNSGSIDLIDAQLSLKAALKIITLTGPAAKAADVNSDGFIDLTDAQITLKIALHIMSVDDLYLEPDYLEMFISAINEKNFHITDNEEPSFLAICSESSELTNEQLLNYVQNYHGVKVCTFEDLHKQGLLSVPSDKPITGDYSIPHGVILTFSGAKTNNKQIIITWRYSYSSTHGARYDSIFEVKNRKWVLVDSILTGIS